MPSTTRHPPPATHHHPPPTTPQVPVPRKELIDLVQENYKDHKDIKKIPGLVISFAQVGSGSCQIMPA